MRVDTPSSLPGILLYKRHISGATGLILIIGSLGQCTMQIKQAVRVDKLLAVLYNELQVH